VPAAAERQEHRDLICRNCGLEAALRTALWTRSSIHSYVRDLEKAPGGGWPRRLPQQLRKNNAIEVEGRSRSATLISNGSNIFPAVGKVHVRVRAAVALSLVLAGRLLTSCPSALALDPTLDAIQYAHTAWKVLNGFTKGKINAIGQTPDGYLWLGTDFGLFRFDGVRAVPWQPPAGQQLPDNNVSSLLVARDGSLWIGTLKGPASWKDGRLTEYPELAGVYIVRILEDRQGTIWMSGADPPNGKVCALRGGRADCQGENARLGSGAFGLYEDRHGNVWVGSVSGLWLWKPGPPKLYPLTGDMFGVEALGEDTDGALLLGWKGAIRRFNDGEMETYPLPGVGQFNATYILRDRDGGLWIGTRTEGLVHVHQGRTDVFTVSDGLSGPTVQNIFEDREGNLWVVTASGLDRFRDFAVATFTSRQSLSRDLVSSVLADRDGSVWVATYGGLDRWRDGEIRPWGKREGKLNGLDPTSLFQDSHGQIWVSTNRDFGYLEHDRFVSVSGFPGGIVDGIAEDGRGDLWVANHDNGLIHLSGNKVVEKIPWSRLGHKDNANALTADLVRGGLWLGFYDGGVEHFADAKVQASYTAADGLDKGRVHSLRIEQDGTLWAATEGGLSRLKDGRFFTLSGKNGLPCNGVQWTVEDDDRSLWLYTQCGLVRIARPDVEDWTGAPDKDDKRRIAFTAFDGFDGTPSLAAALWRYTPAVTKSLDGRIWFKAFEGACVIDPHHLPFNSVPPPVKIEQITADRKIYWENLTGNASSSHPRLPPLIRDLTIDYTALSLAVPEKVRFRFKLEGQDRDWREVANIRQVQYSNLAPGSYRFRVTACNNSGVWNEEGVSLEFSIPPAYWQTSWFRALCMAALMGLLWALYQLRLRQLARQFNMTLDARVSERTRIARELHDTLLQSFHGLLLRFQTAREQLPPQAVQARQTLDQALDQAEQAIIEGRGAVQELRASAVESNDLAVAIRTFGEELAAEQAGDGSVVLHVVVQGTPRTLHPIQRDETYRIACEAVRNAFKHASATQIEVELCYEERQLRLRVRDDGKGIDPPFLTEEGRAGHYGLRGMRERAKLMGGKLAVWSALDSGTEVELSIPVVRGYAALTTARSWFAKRFSGESVESEP
jgi:signal transduction histidine kinase/ligand-binding sensor domain-containing protein